MENKGGFAGVVTKLLFSVLSIILLSGLVGNVELKRTGGEDSGRKNN